MVSPSAARRAAVFGPMPGTSAGRRVGEARAGLLAREHDEAGRLLGVGGDLRDELVRADADRAGQLRRAPDLGDQPAHGGARRVQPVEVEIGLVEADDLDALDVRAHEVHDACARPRGRSGSRAAGRSPAGTAAARAPRASPSRRRSLRAS